MQVEANQIKTLLISWILRIILRIKALWKLKENRSSRTFIFVTHNSPSIVDENELNQVLDNHGASHYP